MSQISLLNKERQTILHKPIIYKQRIKKLDIILSKSYLKREHERYNNAQIQPKRDNWDFTGLKITQRQYNVHSFHHYTAKFIPQIPQNIIKQFRKKGDVVFDPFLGSGTTIIEGKLIGHPSYGIEINPLSIKIANSKVNLINFNVLNNFLKWLSFKLS